MIRYNKINEGNKREIVLLKGLPCQYGKCAFCTYILDNTEDEGEIKKINLEVLENITGEYGVLEVINSGSVFELPESTLERVKEIVEEKDIKIIYFEAYFGYVNKLDKIREYYNNQEVRFIIGIETFDNNYRQKVLRKNFHLNDRILEKLKKEYNTALLMICTKGQTKEQILEDIRLAREHFKEVTISVFINNGTKIERDEELVEWFVNDIYPSLSNVNNIEVLIDNKDLGVYVQ